MARQEFSIGAANVNQVNFLGWDPPSGNRLINPEFIEGGVTAYLRWLSIPKLTSHSVEFRIDSADSGTGAGTGPDLTSAAEQSTVLLTIRAGNLSITIVGPSTSGSSITDSSEPYSWVPNNRQDIINFASNYLSLSQSDRDGTTLILDDGTDYPAGYWAELRRSSLSTSLQESPTGRFAWLVTSDGLPLEQEYRIRGGSTWNSNDPDTAEPDYVIQLDFNRHLRFRKTGKVWIPSDAGTPSSNTIAWDSDGHYRFFESGPYPEGYWAELVRSSSDSSLIESATGDWIWLVTSDGEPLEQERDLGILSWTSVSLDTEEPDFIAGVTSSGERYRFRKTGKAWIPGDSGTVRMNAVPWNGGSRYRFFEQSTSTAELETSPTLTSINTTVNLSQSDGDSAIEASPTLSNIDIDINLSLMSRNIHTFTITCGTTSGLVGYWDGNIGTITNATYTLPNGSDATIRQCMIGGIIGTTNEVRFLLNQPGLSTSDADRFPLRIVATNGDNSVEFIPQNPDQIASFGQGIGRDYTRDVSAGGSSPNQIFVDGDTILITLHSPDRPIGQLEASPTLSSIDVNVELVRKEGLAVNATLGSVDVDVVLSDDGKIQLETSPTLSRIGSSIGLSVSGTQSLSTEPALSKIDVDVVLGARGGVASLQVDTQLSEIDVDVNLSETGGAGLTSNNTLSSINTNIHLSLPGSVTAYAGLDKTISNPTPGKLVELMGEALNFTGNRSGLKYSWKQISGPTITLEDSDQATACFRLPYDRTTKFVPTTGQFNIGDRGRVHVLDEGVDGVYKVQERVDTLEGTIALSLIRDLDEAYITDESRLGLVPVDYVPVFTPQDVTGLIFTEKIASTGGIDVTLHWTNPPRNDGTHIRALINGSLVTEATVRGNNFTWPGRSKGDRLEIELYGVLDDTISELAVKALHIVGTRDYSNKS